MAFDALEVALEINRTVAPLARAIRLHDHKLAEQIRSATQSISSNLAKGRRRVGRDRLHFFRIASGSNNEVRLHLLEAEAWGLVSGESLHGALELLDREAAMTWRLTHPRR